MTMRNANEDLVCCRAASNCNGQAVTKNGLILCSYQCATKCHLMAVHTSKYGLAGWTAIPEACKDNK